MFKLGELLEIQKAFADTLTHKPTLAQYILALNVEIAELVNTLPWKWWKQKQGVNKAQSLDELADVLAFWLSAYNLIFKNLPKASKFDQEQIIKKEIELITANIEYGIARELAGAKPSKMEDVVSSFETIHTITSPQTAGRKLGGLIGHTMRVTGATILEVQAAYKSKMLENENRQKQGY